MPFLLRTHYFESLPCVELVDFCRDGDENGDEDATPLIIAEPEFLVSEVHLLKL